MARIRAERKRDFDTAFRLEADRLSIESIPAPSPNAPALGIIRAILEFTRAK
jgi:hypothetical protein